jgi:hypothetical protein
VATPTEATSTARKGIPWRRWNNAVHRDLGYFCVALTIVYAVSGVAVNHVADWNPNYRIERVRKEFPPIAVGSRDVMVAQILEHLDLPEDYVDAYRPNPAIVEIFYDDFTVTANATKGVATWERRSERPGLYDANFLHLNYGKGWWTWFADLYAVSLVLLAVTGVFVLRGRKGLTGRGKWWIGAGFVVPGIFLVLMRYAG